jgi:hypothetical protein
MGGVDILIHSAGAVCAGIRYEVRIPGDRRAPRSTGARSSSCLELQLLDLSDSASQTGPVTVWQPSELGNQQLHVLAA